ncbi:MAG TPA: hypothetical protein V6D23_21250 [Candidatus Obscuribacterales bacterium]
MADRANKVAAIFGNHQALKDALVDLNQSGFNKDEVSVLIKRQPDDTTDIEPNEVRTYSTATYPSTIERSRILTEKDTGTYSTSTRDVGFNDPLTRDRNLGYDPVTGTRLPGESFVPLHENVDLDTGIVKDRELVTDEVDVDRLDKNIADENDVAVKDPSALMKDSMKGGAVGLLVGAAALLIPGVGPVMAAGPIAAAIAALATGAAIGTTAGALVGLFQDEGIPSDRVDTYRGAFEAGKGIIFIKPKNEGDEITELNLARSILNRHNPEMVELIG